MAVGSTMAPVQGGRGGQLYIQGAEIGAPTGSTAPVPCWGDIAGTLMGLCSPLGLNSTWGRQALDTNDPEQVRLGWKHAKEA